MPRKGSPTPAERRFVSVAVAAALTGTSQITIRRRIADGTLTAHRFGPKLLRLDLGEIEEALRPIPAVSA